MCVDFIWPMHPSRSKSASQVIQVFLWLVGQKSCGMDNRTSLRLKIDSGDGGNRFEWRVSEWWVNFSRGRVYRRRIPDGNGARSQKERGLMIARSSWTLSAYLRTDRNQRTHPLLPPSLTHSLPPSLFLPPCKKSAPAAGDGVGAGQKPKQGATTKMSTIMGSLDPLVVAGVAAYVATAYAFWGIFREYFDWTESLAISFKVSTL